MRKIWPFEDNCIKPWEHHFARSKGYRLYCPSHNTRIVESRNAKFLENDLISGSDRFQDIVYEKDHIDAQPSTSSDRLIVIQNAPQVQTGDRQPIIEAPQIANDNPIDQVVQDSPEIVEQPVEQRDPQENVDSILRRSTRVRKPAIVSDYVVYLQELDYDIGAENDPETFSQVISCKESNLWYDAMKDEMNSMASNGVWNLVRLPNGAKAIGCKWVFKIKKDSLGNIKRYKARLVAKGFTQNEGIDYKETFSPISKKDSLHIIMTLVAHFDSELQQMDVITKFLNGNLEEEVYMKQPEGFSSSGGEHLVCKLKKSIYGLKQASHQWYLKFHDVISSFGFVENIIDQCTYQKVSESKICFLVLYVDDILLATNNKGLLHEVKQFLSKTFDMKDMGDATYVIGIKIQRDRFRGLLGLSQETYINKVLERFRMKDCSPSIAPIVKGDRFNLDQCPKNDLEREQMKNIPYASAIGSLMYVQVCTRPDIAFTVGMLGRYQSNPSMDHWKATKKTRGGHTSAPQSSQRAAPVRAPLDAPTHLADSAPQSKYHMRRASTTLVAPTQIPHRGPSTKKAKTSEPGESSRAPRDSQSQPPSIRRPRPSSPIEGNSDCRSRAFHVEAYFDHTILRQQTELRDSYSHSRGIISYL
ncbi:hypothetical protein VitviT2T_026606 [Vitis vinifera]|uniref:Reverse transcriptase Ty1/copia-type domain-containing protein n=1 Tax=Vitis vinifera TaxID=29760 RepID=A0ABY9DQA8_VITVI|nr:hypothetical protein VitviT2T_026606 [Vitis vinifera]